MMTFSKNRASTSLTVATLIALTTMAYSNASEAKPRGFKKNPERQFARLDVNQDGYVDIDEMLTPAIDMSARRFERGDADASGDLSLDEFATGRRSVDLSDIAEDIVACVADVQAETGDENILVPDVARFAAPEDKFAALDTSGDGLVDLAEVQVALTDRVSGGFTAGDEDADGLLTLEEFSAVKAKGKASRRAVRGCIADLNDDDSVV